MHINDSISEFIGALANMVMTFNQQKIQKEDFNAILRLVKIETSQGAEYQNPEKLINKAIDYWNEKDQPTVARNIDSVLR